MADNSVMSAAIGVGVTVGDDDISGIKYQRVKLIHGADGTNDGDVSTANPYPVRLYVGTTAVTANAGAVAAGTPRVTLASDDPAVVSLGLLDNAIAGNEMQCDVITVPADPFGVNADAASATGSISAKLRFIASTGIPITGTVTVSNAGTFAVQAACVLQAETTKVIGTVNIAASQTVGLAAGVAEIGNVKNSGTFAVQAACVLQAETTKVIGTINIAAGQAVNATLAAETTKVIGTVNIAAAQTLATVTTVSAVTAITNALPAGSNVIGKVSIDQATPGTTNAVQTVPGTVGGLLSHSFLSTGAVQATEVKNAAGHLYSIEFFNIHSAAVYLRIYNQTGAPGTGDAANILWRGIVPRNTDGGGFVVRWPNGKKFSTGIGFRCTAAVADNDNTALTANTVLGNLSYF